jgi:TetR/AcrR family transcriptional repressor of mexJK operon
VLDATTDLDRDLRRLGASLLSALMQPDVLRLRRLVISCADRFPEIGSAWYAQGFEQVLTTLATKIGALTDSRHLAASDPLAAAEHFVGLLLWIPINRAMFTGIDAPLSSRDISRHSDAAVSAFLGAYGAPVSGRRG